MQYFKHMSNMRHDVKVRRLISRYGLEGYGLYCLIIEAITEKLTTENPTPDLQETCDDMACFYNGNSAKIDEIVHFMINQGLLEVDSLSKRVTCNKIYKFLEASQTRSDQIRDMIKNYKFHHDELTAPNFSSQTVSDKSDRTRTEQNRTRTEQEAESADSEHSEPQVKSTLEGSEAHHLANLLYTEHLKHDPKFLAGKDVKKTLLRWAGDIEKLIRIDQRSPEEVERVIRWCQADNFWKSNILSGGTLREKFDRLFMACGSRRQPQRQQSNMIPNSNQQWLEQNRAKLESKAPPGGSKTAHLEVDDSNIF